MRRIPRTLGLAAVLGLVLAPACSSDDGDGAASTGTTAPTGTSSGSGGTLYVLTADGATLADGTLELTGAAPEVTVFADRPARSAGIEPIDDLVTGWAELGFTDDPPNAALVTTGQDGHVTTVVELGAPTIDGEVVTFPATTLSDGAASGALAALPSGDLPAEPGPAALFIDDGAGGTAIAFSIDGTWGGGASEVTFDGWTSANVPLPAGGMLWQMDQPGVTQFSANTGSFAVVSNDAVPGTFFGFGITDDPTALTGTADLATGTDLQITVCGSGGPTTPFTQGSFSVPIPAEC